MNVDGQSFALEIGTLASILGALDTPSREQFRDRNAYDIAQHDADRILIVAGPGTGKSFLFMARIQHWLSRHPCPLYHLGGQSTSRLLVGVAVTVERERGGRR